MDSAPVATSGQALRLFLVYPRGLAVVLVAARDKEHARSFPPYSNWRMLIKFGGWHPSEGKKTRVKLIGDAAPDVEAGPVMFGAA